MTDDRTATTAETEAELQRQGRRALANDALPTEVTSRLDAARRQAVDAVDSRRNRWLPTPAAGWASAAAVAATVVLGIAVLLPRADLPSDSPRNPPRELPHELPLESPGETISIESLLSSDDIELMEELEFYAWLDELEATEPETTDHG